MPRINNVIPNQNDVGKDSIFEDDDNRVWGPMEVGSFKGSAVYIGRVSQLDGA